MLYLSRYFGHVIHLCYGKTKAFKELRLINNDFTFCISCSSSELKSYKMIDFPL